MKNIFLLLATISTSLLFSQVKKIPLDTMVVTNHNVVIKGQSLSYQATAGTRYFTPIIKIVIAKRKNDLLSFRLMVDQVLHLFGCTLLILDL